MARDADHYLGLITPFFQNKNKFRQTVAACVNPLISAQQIVEHLPKDFDLDEAIGVQLDIVGQWVGRSRYVTHPLPSLFFTFGDSERGFGRGIWRTGNEESEFGISRLEDETYRRLLRAKIAANHWDGSIPAAAEALSNFFEAEGTHVFAVDHQDMSMTYYAAGKLPDLVGLAILDAGYIPLKPAGVRVNYMVVSARNAPIFGFGVQNQYVSGFGSGAWAVPPDYILSHTIT